MVKFKMDVVQRFISENHHQFGYIMQEASRQWIEKDKVGALTVGDCNFVVEKYGQYHEILEKMQRYENALKEINNLSVIKDNLSDAGYIAQLALNDNEI